MNTAARAAGWSWLAFARTGQRALASLAVGLALLLAGPAAAAQREALVIAVAKYQAAGVGSLANPVNDARLVAAALRATGFAVAEVIDPDRATILRAVGEFRERARGAEAALIYFAGHGVEIGGSNYLLPRDAVSGSEELIKANAVQSTVLGTGVNLASRMRLLVLDACRDNPFANIGGDGSTRSLAASRGLAREEVKNVVTLLATASGQKAADRSAVAPNNSPFARAFSEAVQVKGLDVTKLPTRVANLMATKDQVNQKPDQIGVWSDEDFMLVPGERQQLAVAAAPAVARQAVAVAAQTIEKLGLKVARDPGSDGIRVVSVAQDGPGFSKLFNNDVIVRINGELVDGSVDPATAIAQALEEQSVIRLGLRRGQILVNAVLRPVEP